MRPYGGGTWLYRVARVEGLISERPYGRYRIRVKRITRETLATVIGYTIDSPTPVIGSLHMVETQHQEQARYFTTPAGVLLPTLALAAGSAAL